MNLFNGWYGREPMRWIHFRWNKRERSANTHRQSMRRILFDENLRAKYEAEIKYARPEFNEKGVYEQ